MTTSLSPDIISNGRASRGREECAVAVGDPPPAAELETLTSFLRSRDVACPTCKYNLRGNISSRCPECGSTLHLKRHEAAPEPEPPACIRCGYDLYGLPADGNCPECGTWIKRSMAGDRLGMADPKWVSKLAIGQTLICWGTWLPLIAVGLMVLVMLNTNATLPLAIVMLSPLVAGAAACFISGALLATARDPSVRGFERVYSSRGITRLAFAGPLVFGSLALLIDPLPIPFAVRMVTRATLLLLAGGSAMVLSVALLQRLGTTAKLMPNKKLAKSFGRAAAVVAWALPMCLVGLVVVEERFRSLVTQGTSIDPWALRAVLGCSTVLAGFFLCVVYLRLAFLMLQLRRGLIKCRDEARTHWQRRQVGG